MAHEEERRKQRLMASIANDVWEYRMEPPEDWMKQIPAKLTQTLAKFEPAEAKAGPETESAKPKKDSMCVIS